MSEAIGLAREIFGLSALTGLVVSFVVVWSIRRAVPATGKHNFSLPLGISLGFFAGYCVLHGVQAVFVPKQSWQWLPYLGLAIACITAAPAGARYGRASWSRVLIGCIAAGCLLTPKWPILGVNWPLTIGLAIAYLLLIAGPLEMLPDRLIARTLLAVMTFAAVLSAAAIGVEVSVKYAQLAAIAAGSLAGALLGQSGNSSPAVSAIRAAIPLYAALLGGTAFIATIEPEKPLFRLLLPPLAPVVVWIGMAIRRPHGHLPPN